MGSTVLRFLYAALKTVVVLLPFVGWLVPISGRPTLPLLTVAAEHLPFPEKSTIKLRVLLHGYPSPQDATLDNRELYCDPLMVELRRQKVDLCYGKNLRVDVELILVDGTKWGHKKGFLAKQEWEGVLVHSSENLADFCLEAEADAPPLFGHIKVTFHHSATNVKTREYLIDIDYPNATMLSKGVSQAQGDLLDKIFTKIAREIAGKSSELAVGLGVKDHDRHEIARKYKEGFDQNYEMLKHWSRNSPESATVGKLIQVLVECGRADLAEATHKTSVAGHKASVSGMKTGPVHKSSLSSQENSGSNHSNRPRTQETHVLKEDERQEREEMGSEEPVNRKRRSSEKQVSSWAGTNQ